MDKFDIIILGGGPAGYNAAERAAEGGLKTLVIEKRALGGVCLNEGCVPSKTLLQSAKVFDYANHGEKYGVKTAGATIDQGFVIERKNKVVKTLVSGIAGKLKKLGVTVLNKTGKIIGKEGADFIVEAESAKYASKYLLIASGSEALVPPIPGVKEGIESGFVLTNREVLDLKQIPENFVVIGGGVIGLEMASYFNSVGSKVTVIEMMDKIAGPTDAEISKILMNNYAAKGVEFLLKSKVVSVENGCVKFEKDGKACEIKADKVLLSIGRKASSANIGLENIGVFVERGAVKTDEHLRTNVPNVYAAGDINGKSMLAHTAYREGEVAINHILGKRDYMRYNAIPSVIYTQPEVASVGETEETAKEKGYDVKTVNLSMRYSGRYIAENEGGDGICKVIIDKKHNTILGVHIIGGTPSESIFGVALMIEAQFNIDTLKEIVFPHPTCCEVIREALFEKH